MCAMLDGWMKGCRAVKLEDLEAEGLNDLWP